jgi:hypothetical protein
VKVTFSYGIGIADARREEVVELPDDFTDEDIEEEFKFWCSNFVDAAWWKSND